VNRVSKPGFSVDVPVSWTEVKSDDGFEFVSPDRAYQLIVSVYEFKRPADAGTRRATVKDLVDTRLAAFGKMSGGSLVPVEIAEDDSIAVTSLVGVDVVAGVCIYTRILAGQLRIVTGAVYRYGGMDDQASFIDTAEKICKSMDVSDD
jgi:hypothetical protein